MWVNAGVFRREFRVIAQLGRTTEPSQFGPEFEAYVYESVRDKVQFRMRTLGLRLSRRRFEKLAAEVRKRSRNRDASEDDSRGESVGATAVRS